MTDWKSSVSGLLSFAVATLTTLSAILASMNVNDGGSSASSIHVSTWIVIGVNGGLALCRAWIGLITQNASAPAVAAALAAAPASPEALPTVETLTKTPPAPPAATISQP